MTHAINRLLSEAADEAYDLAEEAAAREIDFEMLLDALLDLSNAEKEAALNEAAGYHPTLLLAQAWENLLQEKTSKARQQAT